MVTHSHRLKQQRSVVMLPAITTLARKLLRQTWGLLLVTLCGLIASVGLVCAIPLFSQVAVQTGLQGVLKQIPGGAQITTTLTSNHPTATQQQQVGSHVDHLLQSALRGYVENHAQTVLATPKLQVLNTRTGKAIPNLYVSIYGSEASTQAKQVTVLQGRLPQAQPANNEIEIALTQAVASKLGLQLDSRQQVRFPIAAGSTIWQLHVVGIVAIRHESGNIWFPNVNAPSEEINQGIDIYSVSNDVLASLPAILPRAATIQISQQNTGVGNVDQGANVQVDAAPEPSVTTRSLQYTVTDTAMVPLSGGPGTGVSEPDPQFIWYRYYPLNVSHIDAYNLGDVTNAYHQLGSTFNLASSDAHITFQTVQSSAIEDLSRYHQVIPFELVAVILLLVSLLGLALYTVSLLANVLIERQLTAIVMLRSRGATQRHIFGAFAMQGFILCLIALLAGPVLAITLVGFVAQNLLPPTALSAFATMLSHLPMTIQQIWLAALLMVAGALLVMMISLRRASRIGIVELRQQNSRVTQKPLWMRLGVDFFMLLLIAAGVAYYQLLSNAAVGASTVLAPLAFLAAPAILFTVALLFLRCFPALTRLGTRIISKSKAAPGVLAFAQMERQPHATLRMILLLSLSLASSIYLLTFINTQQSRMVQVANYQIGADFSGDMTVADDRQDFASLKAQYAAKPGVASATLGYHDTINFRSNELQILVNAVDTDTYAQTAVWSSAYADQPLKTLMDQLGAHRTEAVANNEIFVVADDRMWKGLNLSPGQVFTLNTDNEHFQHVRFVALAHANYLPRMSFTQIDPFSYSMLIDYQTYSAVYAKNHAGTPLQPDYLWLKTHDDVKSLSQVRQAFPDLHDRRALIEQVSTEPLQVAIKGTLMLGLIIALILSLIGVGITAWLSVKQRRTNFSVLRALGMTPGQISRILLWEQGTTYLFSLLIGLLIGWLCTLIITPAFSLVDEILQSGSIVFSSGNMPLAKNPPLPMNWIGLALLTFVVICGCVLLWMSNFGSRPAMSQALRLNED